MRRRFVDGLQHGFPLAVPRPPAHPEPLPRLGLVQAFRPRLHAGRSALPLLALSIGLPAIFRHALIGLADGADGPDSEAPTFFAGQFDPPAQCGSDPPPITLHSLVYDALSIDRFFRRPWRSDRDPTFDGGAIVALQMVLRHHNEGVEAFSGSGKSATKPMAKDAFQLRSAKRRDCKWRAGFGLPAAMPGVAPGYFSVFGGGRHCDTAWLESFDTVAYPVIAAASQTDEYRPAVPAAGHRLLSGGSSATAVASALERNGPGASSARPIWYQPSSR